MKKFLCVFFAVVLITVSAAVFSSCSLFGNGSTDTTTAPPIITTGETTTAAATTTTKGETTTSRPSLDNITFSDLTVEYDGKEHVILISGTLPEGVTVTYINNKATDVGKYGAVAVISGDGYEMKMLNAVLTITAPATQETTTLPEVTTAPVTTTVPDATTVAPETTTKAPVVTTEPEEETTAPIVTTSPTETTTDPSKKLITGVSFPSLTVTYDGKPHTLSILGAVPAGVTIMYENNVATDAGTYIARAIMTGIGYNTLELNAVITINPATISGVTLPSRVMQMDGNPKSLLVDGNVPSGVTVTYTGNGVSTAGTHNITATLSGKNYKTLVLNGKMTLISSSLSSTTAGQTVTKLFEVPDLWSYIPESLRPSGRRYTGQTLYTYSDFVKVSDLPQGGCGIQLKAISDLITRTDDLLSPFKTFFNTYYSDIVSMYQAYLTATPGGGDFSATVSAYKVRILNDSSACVMYLSWDDKCVEITLTNEGILNCRVQLSLNDAFRYVINGDNVKIDVDRSALACWEVEFNKAKDGTVTANFYNNELNAGAYTAYSSCLRSDATSTIVIGNRGNYTLASSGRTCETYDTKTGVLKAIETGENYNSILYDFVWFDLSDINGITSVKKTDIANGANPDTVYINSQSQFFMTQMSGGVRIYDIQFVSLYYYVTTSSGNLSAVMIEVPMMLVQRSELETYASAAVAMNLGRGFDTEDIISDKLTLKLSASDKDLIKTSYEIGVSAYGEMRSGGSTSSIKAAVGNKNSYFD